MFCFYFISPSFYVILHASFGSPTMEAVPKTKREKKKNTQQQNYCIRINCSERIYNIDYAILYMPNAKHTETIFVFLFYSFMNVFWNQFFISSLSPIAASFTLIAEFISLWDVLVFARLALWLFMNQFSVLFGSF